MPETLSLDDVNTRLTGNRKAPTSRADVLSIDDVNARLAGSATPSAPAPVPVMGRLESAGGAYMQGAADVFANVPKALGIAERAIQRKHAELIGIDPGLYGPPQTTETYQAGEALSRAARESFPTDPAYREEFLAEKLPRGLGSATGYVGTAVAGRFLGLPPLVVTGATGAAGQSVEQFTDALRNGASLEDSFLAAGLGAIAGTSEAVPVVRVLDRFDKASGGTLKRVLIEGVKGGAEEAVQETFQQIAGNLIASEIVKYDPDRGTFEGSGEGGAVGFTVGALFSVVSSMLGARVRGREAPGPAEEPPQAAAEGEPTGPGLGGASQVITPRGRRVDVRAEVVEADTLLSSDRPGFPAELQPRDRSRAASGEQVAGMAANLEPELLGETASATDGAPIIGPDGVVESGNARVMAIREAYRRGLPGAESYHDFLRRKGYEIEGMREPVLVRRRVTELSPDDRAAFTREANERTTAGMSASEQAGIDAEGIPDHILDLYRGGSITSGTNRDFVRGFVDAVVAAADRASVYTREGALSQEGERRIENALFARAYGDVDMLAALREDPDANFRSIGGAMVDAAPFWAQMRRDASAGTVPRELDITPALIEAVALVRRARSERTPLADVVRQGDLVSGGLSPEGAAMLRLAFRDDQFRRPASRDRMAGALRFYATEARKANADPGLFPGQPKARPLDILNLARQRSEGGLLDVMQDAAEARLPDSRGPVAENIAQGRTAVEKVLSERGSVPSAMIREDVAAITFDYGEPGTPEKRFEDGWGISHMIERRNLEGHDGEAFVRETLPEVLARGRLDRLYGPPNGRRADIVHRGDRVVLSLYRFEDRETWVLTGFGKEEGKRGSGGAGGGFEPSGPTQRDPTLTRSALGADPTESISPDGESGKPETLSLDEVNARVHASQPGTAYTGFVQDQVDAGVEASARKEPLRREDILRPLMTALGVPLYQGRMKKRKALGFFRPKLEEVRIKKMGDIETTSHEIAHLLDDRIKEIRRQWYPARKDNETVRDELRSVSYDASKLYEGFAEFVRLWATQKDRARAAAPKFFGWFEDFVARSEYGPALRNAQEDMHAWFAQDAVERARSKVGVTKEINAGLTSVFDKFRQSVFDDLHGIMRMERELSGGLAPVGAYETARLTRGKHAMIEGALLYGAPKVNPDGSHSFVGKGLSQILDPIAPQLDDFLMYAVGRSARELHQQGRERLFTKAEVDGMVRLETPEFRRAFEQYQDWNKAILDFAQVKGLISGAQRASWRRTQYLPFHRVGQPGAFSPVPGDWKGIKALTGGTDNLRDILGNMIGNARMLIDAALTNEARLAVTKLTGLRGSAKFLARIPTESRWVQVHRAEVERRVLEALGVRHKNALPVDLQKAVDQIINGFETFVPFEMKGQAPAGGNVVAALRGGKPDYYEVADPLLFRALTSLNRPSKHWLVKLLSIPRRIGQASITLTPDFLAANIARDTLMGSIMSRHGFKPLIDSARGLASRIRTDQNYKNFIANGGGFASYLVDEAAYRTHLERFYTRKGIDPRAVLDTPAKLLLGLERIADAVEMSTRLGEFRQATKRGEHPRHAAYSSREVSTDFGMRGDSAALGFMYDTVIFLKAAMNGIDRLYRGLAHDPNKGAIAAKTALLAMASMGLYALNRGNPLYDDLEDWDKDTHWHLFVPTNETIEAWSEDRELPPLEQRYHHSRYPKIWEIGAVASIAERSLAAFLDGQPGQLGTDAARIIHDVFRMEYLPQAVAPAVEVYGLNRNRFTQRTIETQAMKELEPWARSGPYTSEAMKRLGESTRDLPAALQISPARAEALLRGYLNTWGLYGFSLADAAVADDKADMRLDDYPVLRRFYRQEPSRSSRHVSKLYDAIEAATQARRTMRFMDRTYRPDLAGEMEHKPANLEYSQLTRADRTLRNIRRERGMVNQARSLEQLQDIARLRALIPGFEDTVDRARRSGAWGKIGTLKRQLLDDVIRERNAFSKSVMQDVKAQRRETEAAR